MNKNKHKLQCNPKSAKINQTKDDVGLCLEVEMDEEVKDIITSPEKCASTLLDVTVIKPKEKSYTTQRRTMSGDEVRQFMASMNLDPKTHGHYVDYSSGDGIGKTTANGKDKKKKADAKKVYYLEDPLFFEQIRSILQKESANPPEVQQIYTTPKTFHDLNSMFSCKNRDRLDSNKPMVPCLCKNCAIVGIVTDSQKRPFATEELIDPMLTINRHKERDENCPKKRKCVNFEDEHVSCQLYFKQLAAKIKELEARLAIQEEKSVPKDYFRRIITKLVTHITKITPSNAKITTSSKKYYEQQCRDCKDKYQQHRHSPLYQRYVVHPMIVEENQMNAEKDATTINAGSPASQPQPSRSNPGTWKWGEEILKPGIDLKNKVIALMEETLNTLKWSREKPRENEMKDFVEQFSSNLYKTVNEIPVKEPRHKGDGDRKSYKTNKGDPKKDSKLAYVDSELNAWRDSSSNGKVESKESVNYYKAEFIQTILNTKEEDKRKLWSSIWHQAVANKQTKDDKISIQFPGRADQGRRENIQIEYTIGELENLLLGRKGSPKGSRKTP